MATLRFELVTVERVVYEGEADIVVAPGIEGQLGILPHHAPLITALTYGELMARSGEEEVSFAIGGGFIEVQPDKVTVLADVAERADEIDVERAEAARRRAEERLAKAKTGEIDMERAQAALRRSAARLKVARTKRKTGRLRRD